MLLKFVCHVTPAHAGSLTGNCRSRLSMKKLACHRHSTWGVHGLPDNGTCVKLSPTMVLSRHVTNFQLASGVQGGGASQLHCAPSTIPSTFGKFVMLSENCSNPEMASSLAEGPGAGAETARTPVPKPCQPLMMTKSLSGPVLCSQCMQT